MPLEVRNSVFEIKTNVSTIISKFNYFEKQIKQN